MEIEKLRIGGAQIPVTADVHKNTVTIKTAIDWAEENNVDYLVTPEGSLSGYTPRYNLKDTQSALTIIEEYAKEKNVGLCLGTLWQETGSRGELNRNQIRFYNPDGELIGTNSKHHIIEHDHVVPHNLKLDGPPCPTNLGEHLNQMFPVVGLICNDLWGHSWSGGECLVNVISNTYRNISAFIHSTNGTRGDVEVDKMFDLWHDAHFKLYSKCTDIPIITVDNSIHMDGKPFLGDTSSQSGVVIGGKWVTNVPRRGTQYFYYDFPTVKLGI